MIFGFASFNFVAAIGEKYLKCFLLIFNHATMFFGLFFYYNCEDFYQNCLTNIILLCVLYRITVHVYLGHLFHHSDNDNTKILFQSNNELNGEEQDHHCEHDILEALLSSSSSLDGDNDEDGVLNGAGVGDAKAGSYSHGLYSVSAGSEWNVTDMLVINSNSFPVNNDDGNIFLLV